MYNQMFAVKLPPYVEMIARSVWIPLGISFTCIGAGPQVTEYCFPSQQHRCEAMSALKQRFEEIVADAPFEMSLWTD